MVVLPRWADVNTTLLDIRVTKQWGGRGRHQGDERQCAADSWEGHSKDEEAAKSWWTWASTVARRGRSWCCFILAPHGFIFKTYDGPEAIFWENLEFSFSASGRRARGPQDNTAHCTSIHPEFTRSIAHCVPAERTHLLRLCQVE